MWGVLQELGNLLGGCLTCEELSGGYSKEMMGLVKGGYSEEKSHLYVYINVTEY